MNKENYTDLKPLNTSVLLSKWLKCIHTLWRHCAISLCPYLVLRCSGNAYATLMCFVFKSKVVIALPVRKVSLCVSLCLSAWVCWFAAWHWNIWSLIMVLSHRKNETFLTLTVIIEHEHQNRPIINTIWGAQLYIECHICVCLCAEWQ